jgi:hypothetical protein
MHGTHYPLTLVMCALVYDGNLQPCSRFLIPNLLGAFLCGAYSAGAAGKKGGLAEMNF